MKICAVICEFNPFHNGHAYFINRLREKGYTHIVGIMSGNFVQRGEAAMFSKQARAEMAVCGGINLVVEIPSVYSVTTAEKYARFGVYLASVLGCVDCLAFGSELGDINALYKAKNILSSPDFNVFLKKHLSLGITFAKAREKAMIDVCGEPEFCNCLKLPNNILGIEYLKALEKIKSSVAPITFKRKTNSLPGESLYASSSKIRSLIENSDKSYEIYIPNYSARIINREILSGSAPASLALNDRGITANLRKADALKISELPDISEGIENRINKAVKNSFGIADILKNIKTKRYTLSRIKRIILCSFLEITEQEALQNPCYLRVLGADKKGEEILNKAKKTSKLPIIGRYKDVCNLSEEIQNSFAKECVRTDLYGTLTPVMGQCYGEQTFKMIKGEEHDL